MLKNFLRLVLVAFVILSLFGCKKTLLEEKNGEEAWSYLDYTLESYNISTSGYGNNVVKGLEVKYKVNLKENYKDMVVLKKILNMDLQVNLYDDAGKAYPDENIYFRAYEKYSFDNNNNIITVFFPLTEYPKNTHGYEYGIATPIGQRFECRTNSDDEIIKQVKANINILDDILTESYMEKKKWTINIETLKLLIEIKV